MLKTRRHIGAMSRPWWAADSSALQSRSNQIRNNSAQGAVAGTPGTVPTLWAAFVLAGLTQTIVGTGVENGIDYVDVRVNGTTSGTSVNFYFESATGVAAVNAQVWTGSAFLKLVGGSFANVSAATLSFNMRTAVGSIASLNGSNILSSIASVLTRVSATVTLNQVTTEYLLPFLAVTVTNTASVDFTIRIGWPMLHLGSVALSPIRTTDAVRTGVHVSAGR